MPGSMGYPMTPGYGMPGSMGYPMTPGYGMPYGG
jgi:hypothetical protein